MTSIYVAIATVGRPELVRKLVKHLAAQTRPADAIIVVGVTSNDVDGVSDASADVTISLAERGLCKQRNRALDLAAGKADVIIFFDDDFVPAANYLSEVEAMFADDPTLVGITGQLIADGINNEGYTFDQALRLLETGTPRGPVQRPRLALYGCNMAIRMSAAGNLRFDEALPLYGWQEDIDFTYQLGQRGHMQSAHRVTGVHLGSKSSRTPGRKLGYSQIANIVYLQRKGTMQPKLGERLIINNFLSNLVRSAWAEPHIDRRGRLAGNLMAFFDWATGRIDPGRIERM